VNVEVVEDRLRLRPAEKAHEVLLARLRPLKAEILALLATHDPVELWRRTVELMAERLRLPPDVLQAARQAKVKWSPYTGRGDQ
jgi:hypothetical protein